MADIGCGEVRPARAEDVDAAAGALGEAAVDEEVSRWVTPDEEAARRRGTTHRPHVARWLEGARRSGELLLVGGEGGTVAGVALWEFRAAGPPTGDGDDEADAVLAEVYGEGLARLALVGELVAARHPRSVPHWYLAQMAVVPDQRGRGLGGALLRHHLARADVEGHAAYLEASSPRNQALYARHGFVPAGPAIPLPDGGPILRPMWRRGASPHPAPPDGGRGLF
ncbi:GNAT family N-acetyltransferase [Streptomyces sp. SBT349]|uniref:GNAT family N-acetyltransferase n=1 Tax=Streptomyces sp. SBT349 TaxID=1580539 RepID=UPI0007C6E93E|nr:GNAT family N-acetyltransferase [Streptomyces sp. SBT349]